MARPNAITALLKGKFYVLVQTIEQEWGVGVNPLTRLHTHQKWYDVIQNWYDIWFHTNVGIDCYMQCVFTQWGNDVISHRKRTEVTAHWLYGNTIMV